MKRIISSLLTLLLLLCAALPASAEETADYQGTWSMLYVIRDGVACTPDELGVADALIIDGTTCSSLRGGEILDTESCTPGENGLVLGGDVLELVAPDMLIVRTAHGTLVLRRIGPVPFRSPFAGEWVPLVGYMNGRLLDAADEETTFSLTFTAEGALDATGEVYPCTYADAQCIITRPNGTTITAQLDENGLITMTDDSSDVVLLLVRAQ